RHRGRRQEDGLLVPEERGHARLELVHGRVLPLLLVSDAGVRHRLGHPGRWQRGGVRPEVDQTATASRAQSATSSSQVSTSAKPRRIAFSSASWSSGSSVAVTSLPNTTRKPRSYACR